MNRPCFTLFKSLMLGAVLATAAWSQTTAGSAGLAERVSALRRGWTPATADEDGRATQASPTQASPRGEGRSLVPDWLSRGDETSASGGSASPPAPPREGSVRQAPTTTNNGADLPGLGGSPLPKGTWTPSRNRAATSGTVNRELSRDYPVIRDVTQESSAGAQSPRTTVQSPAASSPSRHSPDLRPVPQVDPEEMRRELAGSFSSGPSGPVARTARANEPGPVAEVPLALSPIENAAPVASDTEDEPIAIKHAAPAAIRNSASAAEAFGAATESRPSIGASDFARSPRLETPTTATGTERRKEAFGEALQVANGGDPTVLVSNQAPIISADIRGPKQIMIGREAVYRVRLQNQGTGIAESVVATVRIPSWADVVGTVSTEGAVQPSQNADAPTQLEWTLARLDGRATETLDIRLIPRESRPLELGISWSVAPVGSRAIVEVQEPKLDIEVTGPSEVMYGRPQIFRLTLSNPGTGPAENVKIELVPPGNDQPSATNHPLGTLQPGETKTVEIELTAREAGKLQVKAIASAEGGLTSDVAKEIFCRKPELELDWRGPSSQYAGTQATYFFRVRNPGTAPAEDVAMQVTLPEGAEFANASEGQSFDAQRRTVSWRVGTLGPGDDKYMELKCTVKSPGVNQFQLVATTASDNLTDSATAETNVIALADLKLAVSDPSGAVAVGSPAVYEIRVANRGASAAKDVTVVALFSAGIEPDQAEGAMYTVTDGRVSFRPIAELPAGREVTFKIRAHALEAGTHVFRAEVLCSDAEIKLAAEETTRFYSDELQAESNDAEQQSAGRYGFEATVR